MSITSQAMTLNCQIGIWQGYRLDKEASSKVTADAGADSDAARVNKHLVPKQALADVVAAANAVRTHLYLKTLPWKDNGDRLLTRKMFLGFIEEHERLVGEFDKAVTQFLTPPTRRRATRPSSAWAICSSRRLSLAGAAAAALLYQPRHRRGDRGRRLPLRSMRSTPTRCAARWSGRCTSASARP
jgi:hypothetical protein